MNEVEIANKTQNVIINWLIKLQENTLNTEIIQMYSIVIKEYKKINNLSKIKEKDSFAYLSCWYIFKKYQEWEKCNKLKNLLNSSLRQDTNSERQGICISNSNINKANRVFYILSKDLFLDYQDEILCENYTWLIWNILENENKLYLFSEILKKYLVEFENDKFSSKKDIKNFITKFHQ